MINANQTIEEQFNIFHEENPNVYKQLEQMSWQLYNAGQKKIGIGMLFEVLRWRSMLKTTGDAYKLNNNYRSRYVRLLIDNNPEFNGFFECRSLKSE